MSDRLRLLERLRRAGHAGVDTFTIRMEGISGNPSQRVRELRAAGCVIDSYPFKRGRRRGARYVLISEALEDVGSSRSRAGVPPGAPPSPGTGAGTLFAPADYPTAPRGAYDEEQAA